MGYRESLQWVEWNLFQPTRVLRLQLKLRLQFHYYYYLFCLLFCYFICYFIYFISYAIIIKFLFYLLLYLFSFIIIIIIPLFYLFYHFFLKRVPTANVFTYCFPWSFFYLTLQAFYFPSLSVSLYLSLFRFLSFYYS